MPDNWTETHPLGRHNPCADAVAEAAKFASMRDWWRHTKRGDWILWAAARDPRITQGSEAHRRLCYAICVIWWECAYPFWYDYSEQTGDERPQQAIEKLETFALTGKGVIKSAEFTEVVRAAGAAGTAWAAGAVGTAWAAWAAWAARAARAAEAAEAARVVRAAWAAEAAWAESLERVAEIVREFCLEPGGSDAR